ncbi:MAG: DEAD/DEAH box helicase [Phenylobacterium sp.]|uniref:DEAD/DEAH box helicase n=1 Tax=Phenylobacterium sp. TaxID=1871053 RepID=UPI0027357FAC|nr:DEAD/DEAH box helicase [Phenylobacterium sp.]MDP3175210.1 DEAD/DEAH box helicase [Phenylobacterium sp.]
MPFSQVKPALQRALAERGYQDATPVQAAVLAASAEGRDLLVSAQTGSGKTVAYGLAAAIDLLGDGETMGPAGAPLELVVAPTRELAMQVASELAWLYASAQARIATCVGGMDSRREQRMLAAGAHIVVGTPGRLRDHLERGHLELSELKVVVLDEADEMLDLGFREDLEFILEATPAARRTLLFSATIAKPIANLARSYQRDAVRIDTTRHDEPHGDIDYRAIRIAPNEIEHAVVNVLRYFESPGALVFCATREAVRHLYVNLRERGFAVVALSGELTQKERGEAMQALRDGRARVCVATDVAARGLDLPDLGLVVHADMPANKAGLLHRSGRTGRAGRKGAAVLLVPYNKRRRVEQLLESANIAATWSGPPSGEEIRAGDQARLVNDPMLSETPTEEDLALARSLLNDRTAEQVAVALVRLHRAALPAPEDVFDDTRGGSTPTSVSGPIKTYKPERDALVDPIPGEFTRMGPDDVSWYRLTTGRSSGADPKWLIPLICRLGHVTKRDIGQIRIFDRETKFEIAKAVEAKFAKAIEATVGDDIRIEEASAPPARNFKGGPGKPAGKPAGGGKPGGKPYKGNKPNQGPRPAFAGKPKPGGKPTHKPRP